MLGTFRCAVGIVREIGERLMMIDKGGVRMTGDCIGKATRIPRPRHTCVGQKAANGRHRLQRQ